MNITGNTNISGSGTILSGATTYGDLSIKSNYYVGLTEEQKAFASSARKRFDLLSKLTALTEEATKSLLYAKAWLGTFIGSVSGEPSPYQNNGKRVTAKDIEPIHDAVIGDSYALNVARYIDKEGKMQRQYGFIPTNKELDPAVDGHATTVVETIDQARQMIQELANDVNAWLAGSNNSRESAIALTQVYVHTIEAKIALGYQLGDIRTADRAEALKTAAVGTKPTLELDQDATDTKG